MRGHTGLAFLVKSVTDFSPESITGFIGQEFD
jgi:hypothetical protein